MIIRIYSDFYERNYYKTLFIIFILPLEQRKIVENLQHSINLKV